MHLRSSSAGPSRGGKGESFSGPRDVWGAPPSLRNTAKGVPGGFFRTSNMHKIHFPPRTTLAEFTTLFRTPWMVRGHPAPRFLRRRSRSRYLQNEVVIGPRDNGFPGPAVALDGPVPETKTRLGDRSFPVSEPQLYGITYRLNFDSETYA